MLSHLKRFLTNKFQASVPCFFYLPREFKSSSKSGLSGQDQVWAQSIDERRFDCIATHRGTSAKIDIEAIAIFH